MATSLPPDAVSLADYERLASALLGEACWAYLSGGSADGRLVSANQAAWQDQAIIPRVLAELSAAHTRVSLFGRELTSPLLLAPTAYHRLFHPEGELATAAAAAALGLGYVVSTQTSIPLHQICAVAPQAPRWFQLYFQADREFTAQLIQRAESLRFEALVLTLDAPVNGIRNAEQRAQFQLPAGVEAVELIGMRAQPVVDSVLAPQFLAALPSWDDIAWLRQETKLPILLKGILHPDDARRALYAGVDGVIVSNHGGRCFDAGPTTRAALPAIAAVIQGKIPLLVDGGLRRGTEVLRALSLGADAVLIGRPILHGLAVGGAPGVAHVLRLLQHELEVALLLSGCANCAATRELS